MLDSPASRHNTRYRRVWAVLQNVTSVLYIDDIMLSRPDEQDGALEALVKHTYSRGSEINPCEDWPHISENLRVRYSRAAQDLSLKIKGNLAYLMPPVVKNLGHNIFRSREYWSNPYTGFALSGVLRRKGSAGGPGCDASSPPLGL